MKLMIESTDWFTRIRGRACRAWIGQTPDGATVHVFVLAIAAKDPRAKEAVKAELREILAPPEYVPINSILR